MAGNSLRPASIGVGSALRRARQIRGITLDGAARDTKLRIEQLRALEEEGFDALGGDVYVRATLRTYAQYLGLNSDKVVGAYAKHADEPEPPPPPQKAGRVERAIAATRIRDNQRFLLIAAAVVLIALIAVGLVSRRAAPPAATMASQASLTSSSPPRSVEVSVVALTGVEVSAVVDGQAQDAVTLRKSEVLSFTATEELTLTASDGSAIDLTLNGNDLGPPGTTGEPWSQTFPAVLQTEASPSRTEVSSSPSS